MNKLEKIEKIRKRGIFSIISPFIIYYLVTMAVEFFTMLVLVMQKMPEIMKEPAMDPEQLSAFLMEEYMPYFAETFLKNILLITGIVALCTIPIFFFMFRRDLGYEKYLGIPQPPKAPIKDYVLIPAIAVAASLGLNNLIILSNIGAHSAAYQETSKLIYGASLGIQILSSGIAVPIAEELMFRAIIYRRMTYMAGMKGAMMYSAVIFGIYHGNLVQGIYGFILGYLCVWIYDKYGSLKAPILFHIVANLTSLFATQFHIFDWIFKTPVKMGVITVICAACASSIFVIIQQKFKKES